MIQLKTRILSVLIMFVILMCCGCQKNKTELPLQVSSLSDTAFDDNDLLHALQKTSKISVFLPSRWPTATRKESHSNFYLMTHIDPNAYDIEIYRSDQPVKMNDEASYLDTNRRPLSESDYIGGVSGEKSADESNNWKTDNPTGNNDIFLTEQGWEFSYIGPGNDNITDQVRDALKHNAIQIAKKGQVKIVEGNRTTITASWQKEGCLYSCLVVGDIQTLIHTINSFQKITFSK